MPEFKPSYYVLAVPDLQRSAAFYREVLGFDVRESGDPGWLFFRRDAVTIMAGLCPDAIPAGELGDHSYFAYLVVAGIDAIYAHAQSEIEAQGGKLLKKLRDEPWGMREFALRTVDGHRIMIGENRS